MKIITHENAPRWYALSCDPKSPSITVSVHQDVAKTIKPVSETAPVVEALIKTFEFRQFEGSLEENFGFEEAVLRSEEGKFVNFTAKLPVVSKLLNYEWDPAFAVSASLNLLFRLIAYPDVETNSQLPQLLIVELVTYRGPNGGSLGGMYSKPLVKWLSAKGRHYHIPEMESAMRAMYEAMVPNEDLIALRSFRASIGDEGGWLNVDCPGNACGLNPESGYRDTGGNGYGFECHNVDTPVQQLTLLAGLAALHSTVDKEL